MSKTTLIGGILLLSISSGVVFAWEKLLLPDGTYACETGNTIEFTGFFEKSVLFERGGLMSHG